MKKEEYREMFARIENTLWKESSLSKELFDERFGEFKNLSYTRMGDDDIFWKMVCVIFYSGFRACTVTKKLPAIKKYLYDFRRVKGYSEKEIDQILDDPGVIHYRRKFEACVANAGTFDSLLGKHGSFSKYIGSFGSLAGLAADLRDKFQYLGPRTVNHFLTDLGLDVLKPDRVVCRILYRLGLIDSEQEIDKAIEVGRNISRATQYPIRYVDIVLVKYGQEGKDVRLGLENGICLKKKPRCCVCGVTRACNYYTNNLG